MNLHPLAHQNNFWPLQEEISMNQSTNIQLLTIDEARVLLQVGRNTMFKMCNKPDFPSIRFGKQIRIPVSHLNKWMEDQIAEKKNILV